MMKRETTQEGVTLVELLVTVAVLMLVLGGIYGMLDSAHKAYIRTRALAESQDTGRVVVNYLLFRLRQIDGGGSGNIARDPRFCTDCHVAELDQRPYDGTAASNDPNIPCTYDVSVPRPNLYLDNLTTDSSGVPRLRNLDYAGNSVDVPDLPGTPAIFKNLSGAAAVTFWADLLPEQGLADTFVDSPVGNPNRNGRWNLVADNNGNGRYDAKDNDREVLFFDYNNNGRFDYYAEQWSFKLGYDITMGKKGYYLAETLAFGNYTSKNRSVYANTTPGMIAPNNIAYQDGAVAYGLTGLGIEIIPVYANQAAMQANLGTGGLRGRAADPTLTCGQTGCHTAYGSTTTFDFAHFCRMHRWWNIRGLSVEVASTDLAAGKFIKVKQFVIPRNLEVNIK